MNTMILVSRGLIAVVLLALPLISTSCAGVTDQIKAALNTPEASSTTQPTSEPISETPSVQAEPTRVIPVAPILGARAPDFALYDLDSVELALSQFRGQPVLLNFWATW